MAKGHHHSEETRRKISEALRGKYTGENNSQYGVHPSEETRRKISKALKGKYTGENNPRYGVYPSEETRRKISEALKGRHLSEEHRRNISDLHKGMRHTEESKRKMSEAHSNRSEETRRKLSDAQRRLNDEEFGGLIRDYIYSDLSIQEIGRKYDLEKTAAYRYISNALKFGMLSYETREAIKNRRLEEKRKKLSVIHKGKIISEEARRKMSEMRKGRHLSEESRRKRAEALSGKNNPFYGKHHTEKTRRIMAETAIRNRYGSKLAELKQKRYTLEGTYYSSMDECATALALQMHIPGYKIKNGETFQVKCGDNAHGHSIFDFVLPNAIVEYHPIILRNASYEDHKAYLSLKQAVTSIEDRRILTGIVSDLREELAVNYWMDRQEYADRHLDGKEVILVRNAYELYDEVISKYGDKENIPSRSEFAKEFNYMRKLAQPIPRKIGNLEEKMGED